MVPDKKEHSWAISNPKDYAGWFESKYIKEEQILLKSFSATMIMEKAEDLPEEPPYHLKQPLQRAVQLIKRFRDIFFEDDDEFEPSSIVLTTLCGHLYSGQNSIYGAIDGIVNNILSYIYKNPNQRIKVVNPVNPEEDFTKEWEKEPRYYQNFIKFIKALNELWQRIKTSSSIDINDVLKKYFGERYVVEALNKQGNYINELRKAKQTSISKSACMASLAGIKNTVSDRPNLFYGSR